MFHGMLMGATSCIGGKAALMAMPATGKIGAIAVTSVTGGIVSEIGGGKFANGAITSAFSFLFNDLKHKIKTSTNRLAISDWAFYQPNSDFRTIAEFRTDIYITADYYSDGKITVTAIANYKNVPYCVLKAALSIKVEVDDIYTDIILRNNNSESSMITEGWQHIGKTKFNIYAKEAKTVNLIFRPHYNVSDPTFIRGGNSVPTYIWSFGIIPISPSQNIKLK